MTDTTQQQTFFAAQNGVGGGVWYHRLEDVVQKMKDTRAGLDIRDRKWRFRTYKNCFVGMCVRILLLLLLLLFVICFRDHESRVDTTSHNTLAHAHICKTVAPALDT